MLSALLYLRLMSLQNWLRSRGRRLRQPKYLFGALVGLAYFYFFFIRSFGGSPRPRGPAPAEAFAAANLALPVDGLLVATSAGSLLLLVFVAFIWVVPTQRAALGFTEAEIAFLFPAPITRRALVHFRLLSSQLRSLVGATVMMLITNRWHFLGGNALTHAIGWWFVFSALSLHFSGATFTLTRLVERGRGVWTRRAFLLVLVLGVFAATFARLPTGAQWPDLGDERSLQPVAGWLVGLTNTAPLGWLLWPFKTVLGPFFAADGRHFLLALGPALAVIVAHYLWVVRSVVAFEDAAIDEAQRHAARVSGWRSGGGGLYRTFAQGRAGPFPLPGSGRPELAFLWKNLLSTWPYFTARVFLVTAAVIAAGCGWLHFHPLGRAVLPGVGMMAATLAVYVLVVGPQFARQDIRNDLGHADVLKTYPLPGWQIILGELLAPAAILTGILWLALLTLLLSFDPGRFGLAWLTTEVRLAAGLGLATLLPVLVSLQLLVPGAAVLLFPGWFQTTRTRGGGPEVVGQRMIFFFAQTLTMVISIVPAAMIGALPFAAAALLDQTGSLALVICCLLSTCLMVAVLAAEVAAGIWLAGGRFEKLDLSVELRP
jgi:hypothetical protein